jgi:circadian clock protein KaiC
VLSQQIERNSVVRKLQVLKVRGQADLPGLHTYRITGDGLTVFPRIPKPEEEPATAVASAKALAPTKERLSTGVRDLDEMLGGGIPRGYSVMVAGPSGSGKTVVAPQFITQGISEGEPGVIAVFEKRPAGYLSTTSLGQDLERMMGAGTLSVLYLRPLDLSVDETLHELRQARGAHAGQARGHRLALRFRDSRLAGFPRGLSRIPGKWRLVQKGSGLPRPAASRG